MNPHLARRAFAGRRLLVCVCGGVAAYKVVELVSELVQAGAEVRVAMTPEAGRFVTPLTFEAVSGRPVASDLFRSRPESEDPPREPGFARTPGAGEVHIALSDWPEAILAAPATANFIAKLAQGLADEVVSATVLASAAPLVLAPAMHHRMWSDPATAANVSTLRGRGVAFAGPVEGRLASGEVGMGRFADPEAVLRALAAALPARPGDRDLAGLRVVVSAGGTREAIDPVRFVGNHTSGRMGHALAAAAAARGAEVTLVTASALPPPAGVETVPVDSAAEMGAALAAALEGADVLVMAAAVADLRPRRREAVKLPKDRLPESLELERNPDLLASLARPGLLRVGFAAETHDVLEHAEAKLRAKGLDLIVANDVAAAGIGMGSPDNAVVILGRDGARTDVPRAPKELVADAVLDAVVALRNREGAGKLVS
jgi:phosphopantothenoylcysteine decarboxylase/phosphopantothenate--cysteine ligase